MDWEGMLEEAQAEIDRLRERVGELEDEYAALERYCEELEEGIA